MIYRLCGLLYAVDPRPWLGPAAVAAFWMAVGCGIGGCDVQHRPDEHPAMTEGRALVRALLWKAAAQACVMNKPEPTAHLAVRLGWSAVCPAIMAHARVQDPHPPLPMMPATGEG